MDVNILKRTNNNTNKNSKENTNKYLLPQEQSPYLTKQINRINYASKKISTKPFSSKSTSVPDKTPEPYINKSVVNDITQNSHIKHKEEKKIKDNKHLSKDYERIVSDYLDARKKAQKQETPTHPLNDKHLPMSMRNSSNNASSVSRNTILKEFVKGNSNRTNYNHTRQNTSIYYSKNNISFKKEISEDQSNPIHLYTNHINTNISNNPIGAYSTSKKPVKTKNFTNFSYSSVVTSRINANLSSTSVPKTEVPATNFLNYKILSQNTNNKIKVDINNIVGSNSFNMPNNYPSNSNNSYLLNQQNRKKMQNHLLFNHLNNSNRNESFSNGNLETNNNYNYFKYIKQGFKSKQPTPELSRRLIEIEGSISENSKEKHYIDSYYNFGTAHDKTEESILRIFQEHNTSGRSINTTILRQIIKDNPEIFDTKKTKTSTTDETIKNTNYSTKQIESDSIEYMHFMFVNFFQKSRQIVQTQENSYSLHEKTNSLVTVTPCDEVEIE